MPVNTKDLCYRCLAVAISWILLQNDDTASTLACSTSSAIFACTNGECIDSSLKCDGKNDCGDTSDEVNCPCQPGNWGCTSNGMCLPSSSRCDGYDDCVDKSDELNCTSSTQSSTTTTPTTTTRAAVPTTTTSSSTTTPKAIDLSTTTSTTTTTASTQSSTTTTPTTTTRAAVPTTPSTTTTANSTPSTSNATTTTTSSIDQQSITSSLLQQVSSTNLPSAAGRATGDETPNKIIIIAVCTSVGGTILIVVFVIILIFVCTGRSPATSSTKDGAASEYERPYNGNNIYQPEGNANQMQGNNLYDSLKSKEVEDTDSPDDYAVITYGDGMAASCDAGNVRHGEALSETKTRSTTSDNNDYEQVKSPAEVQGSIASDYVLIRPVSDSAVVAEGVVTASSDVNVRLYEEIPRNLNNK